MAEEVQTLETPDDAGKGERGEVARWLAEIELASKVEKDWRENDGPEAVERYRDEKVRKKDQFNILWANTQVQLPALYGRHPSPVVMRRFKDQDPVGKAVAQVMERSVAFLIDQPGYDFDHTLSLAVLDMLLPGRGIVRVRYEQTKARKRAAVAVGADGMGYRGDSGERVDAYEEDDSGPYVEYDDKVDETVTCELVHWQRFRHGPAACWEDVPWVAFEHLVTKDEGRKTFGDLFDRVSLDVEVDGADPKREDIPEDVFKRARVWEVWDKDGREVLFIAPSLKDRVLKREDDPMGLRGFFPIPRPLMALETSDKLVPVTDYSQYCDQAKELDRVTLRINRIVDGLRLRGVYDATMTEIARLMQEDDNALLPAENAAAYIAQGRKIEDGIWMMPIDKAALVLRELYVQREQLKQVIYEITGLSDIVRGSSDPRETLGAQKLKAQTGSTRIRSRQMEVQRFVRDLVRMKAEIVAEMFSPETVVRMTGLDPQLVVTALPVLRDDEMRSYRVDVETDSTIAADMAAEREQMTEFFGALNQFFVGIGPAVQSGYLPIEAAKALLSAAVRRFRFGREVEEALASIGQQQQQQGPNPDEQAAAADARAAEVEAQAKAGEAQTKAQLAQMKAAMDAQAMRMQAERDAAKHEAEMVQLARDEQRQQAEHAVRMQELMMKAREAQAQPEAA